MLRKVNVAVCSETRTDNVRVSVTLRRVSVTIFATDKQ